MWYVYILKTKKGQLYTGSTNNLQKRINDHKQGRGARFTRSFGVQKLVYSQELSSKTKALKREAEIKKWPRAQKLLLIKEAKK